MIKNFENITNPLNEDELNLIPILVKGFNSHTQDNPIKARVIVKKTNEYLKRKGIDYKLSEPRLRKCCNYIRSKGLIPLIATSKGYYTSYNKEEIKNQIESLNQRANSIRVCANGLLRFINA